MSIAQRSLLCDACERHALVRGRCPLGRLPTCQPLSLEDELDVELGDAGVVDGGDMAESVIGIFVVDGEEPPRAIDRVEAVLARHNLLESAVIFHWRVTSDDDDLAELVANHHDQDK